MTSNKTILASALIFVTLVSCGKKSSSDESSVACTNATQNASPSLVTTSNNNVIPVYVADVSTTGTIGYANEPLVSVTICSPNHTQPSECQTISNILLDTGSFGLRVFRSAISSNVALVQQTITIQGHVENLGECALFGTGADWGSVQSADVVLGNQTAQNIPIQVIDAGFGPMPTACTNFHPDTDPCQAHFNGIIGVGMFAQDCGANCNSTDTAVNPGNYFFCNGSGCGNEYTGACTGGVCVMAVPILQQIVNPIAKLGAGFNNGVLLDLPGVGPTGSLAVSGSMTIGIGPGATNTPANTIVAYPADANGMTDHSGSDFVTTFNSDGNASYGTAGTLSFIDSGSNGIFFSQFGAYILCTNGSGFYCPATTQTNQQATVQGFTGAPSSLITFSIGNADTLFGSGNTAFDNLGGNIGTEFAWGLPFFLGRPVFVGIDGTTATYNGVVKTGPYWAF